MTVTIQKLTRDGFETVGHVHEDEIEGEEAKRLLEPLMPMSPEEIVDRIDGPRYVAVQKTEPRPERQAQVPDNAVNIQDKSEAPEGAQTITGPRGGMYYIPDGGDEDSKEDDPATGRVVGPRGHTLFEGENGKLLFHDPQDEANLPGVQSMGLNTERVNPSTLDPAHSVQEPELVEALSNSMEKVGWQGAPLVVEGDNALSGVHRRAAADATGIDPPTVEFDEVVEEMGMNPEEVKDDFLRNGHLDFAGFSSWAIPDAEDPSRAAQVAEHFDLVAREDLKDEWFEEDKLPEVDTEGEGFEELN